MLHQSIHRSFQLSSFSPSRFFVFLSFLGLSSLTVTVHAFLSPFQCHRIRPSKRNLVSSNKMGLSMRQQEQEQQLVSSVKSPTPTGNDNNTITTTNKIATNPMNKKHQFNKISKPNTHFEVVPFDPNNQKDVTTLQEICANVYGGGDYLPQMAASYVADPACSFMALKMTIMPTVDDDDDGNHGEKGNEDVTSTAASITASMNHITTGDTACNSEKKDERGNIMVAVANYKRLHAQNAAWIEAVRTHPDYRNRGLASKLLASIVDMAQQEDKERKSQIVSSFSSSSSSSLSLSSPGNINDNGVFAPTNILTCTIQSNKGMQRALQKVGFVPCNIIPTLSFAKLKELPGWAADDSNATDNDKRNDVNGTDEASEERTTTMTATDAQPLLTALDLNHKVSQRAKSTPTSCWRVVSSEPELLSLLSDLKANFGTCGYLPGLYEYIVPGTNRLDLKKSIEHGLVLAFDGSSVVSASTKQEGSDCGNDESYNDGNGDRAILAFTIDKRISSLKSRWVCSIVATSHSAFETALWYACHSSEVGRRMVRLQKIEDGDCTVMGGSDDDDDATASSGVDENGNSDEFVPFPFCLSFDDSLPLTDGSLASCLPLVTDQCVVFKYDNRAL
mmetsp:Transcript_25015/g.50093  ORF Transcript_25015/g.50093 Transcript_25015/m.50093 type:complete len:619 (-) Transcript_25015:25-1881(-)